MQCFYPVPKALMTVSVPLWLFRLEDVTDLAIKKIFFKIIKIIMVLRKHEKMVPCSLARSNTNAGFLGNVLS